MRLRLATRFYGTIAAVVILAIVAGVVGIVSAWRLGDFLHTMVADNLPSVIAAEELEIALLLERQTVRSFVLEADKSAWQEELQVATGEFDKWWAEAQRTAHTPEEDAILDRLEETHRKYVTLRKEIVSSLQAGELESSEGAIVEEFDGLFRQCYNLCEEYLETNQRFANAAMDRAQARIRQLTWFIIACVVMTIASGLLLLGLVVRGVLGPLRQMVTEARLITTPTSAAGEAHDGDELMALGHHLRTLMSNVVDIRSALEENREQLLESEKKLASVGKLAASVAHEIRNPLAGIKMCLLMIRKAVVPNVEAERRLAMAEEEILRLDSIIKSFLEFSRPPALNLQPQDITVLLGKTLELVTPTLEQKEVHLQREATTCLPLVMADSNQLKQVMLNLLKNAAEATPEGGEVRVDAGVVDVNGYSTVVVRIGNSGPPISEEVRARIFEPFFTTKTGGTGLGLCIAARIMAQHGGRLVLESTSRAGTTFAIWIPVAQDKGEASMVTGP